LWWAASRGGRRALRGQEMMQVADGRKDFLIGVIALVIPGFLLALDDPSVFADDAFRRCRLCSRKFF
jgi:hypothetical protein